MTLEEFERLLVDWQAWIDKALAEYDARHPSIDAANAIAHRMERAG